MLCLYRIGLVVFFPILLLKLFFKCCRSKAYRGHLLERFGYFFRVPKNANEAKVIWVHAVSVGEVNATVELVNKLTNTYGDYQILITTMTPTGSQRVVNQFASNVWHCYLPYDYVSAINRFLKHIKPTIGIVMETEIWPNMIIACEENKIPLLYLNVRLSQQSYQGYARFGRLFKPLLNSVHCFAAQSQSSAMRLMDLGVAKDRVTVTGSLKFDTDFPASRLEMAQSVRRQIAPSRPVFVVASTHDKEEEIVIEAYLEAKKQIADLLMVLAPRHPERFVTVARLAQKLGCRTQLRSQLSTQLEAANDILLLDSIGELPTYLAAGDLAFIGGSMVPTGGHNLLEASSAGIPVIFGPHMFNFREIADLVLAKEAGIQINTSNQLTNTIVKFIQDPLLRDQYGQRGKTLIEENRGALERVFALIKHQLK